MPRDWGGNYRSGVELAMRPRLKWFIHLLMAHGLDRDMSIPTTLLMGLSHFTLIMVVLVE